MKRLSIHIVPIVLCLTAFVSSASALGSTVYAYSSVDYDSATDTVTAYSYTTQPAGSGLYYQPVVSVVVYDEDWNLVSDGFQFQTEGGPAEVTAQATGHGCQYYRAIAFHAVNAYYYVTAYQMPGVGATGGFYDSDNYSATNEDPFFGNPYFTAFGPGPVRIRQDEMIGLGQTEVWGSGNCTPQTVAKVQYKVNGTWADVPSGGIGPICNGTSIQFKAVPSSGTFPSGKPTWGGDASGTGAEKTVTFSTTGPRIITARKGNTIVIPVEVAPANTSIGVTWLTPAVYIDPAGEASVTTAEFPPRVPEFTACADPGANVWKLRVKKIEEGFEIVIGTAGYRDSSIDPPISQAEAIDAVSEMNLYYTYGRREWHNHGASEAHENYHISERHCAGDHFWAPTEIALEALTVPYSSYSSQSAAISQLRSSGGNDKVLDFRGATADYVGTLADNVSGSRPYAAGQRVLNGLIADVIILAGINGWNGVPGIANSNPNIANPCYQPFQPYP